MNKDDLRSKMQSGFLEAAPDVYEAVLKAAEKNKLMIEHEELHKTGKSACSVIPEGFEKSRIGFNKRGLLLFWGSFSKYALSVCAVFVLVFSFLFTMLGKNQDNIYVVIDINPSMQIVVNESYQVKKLQGLNQDGKDVVKMLDLKREDSLFPVVDALVEIAVDHSYLHEGEGMLVTISAKDQNIFDGLEEKMGSSIDEKLQEMGVENITTAFQCVDGSTTKKGRELLEKELARKYGMDEERLHQMPVIELIRYCREQGEIEIEFSPASERHWQENSDEKDGIQDKKESKKEEKEQTDDKTGEQGDADKAEDNSDNAEDKIEDKKSKEKGMQNKKSNGKSSEKNQNPDTKSRENVQSQPVSSMKSENPSQPAQGKGEAAEPEDNTGKKDHNGNKSDNSEKGNNNKDNSNKNNDNNKDNANSNKNNNNKDNSNNTNNNKDNKDNSNNNKDNSNKDNNGKDGNNTDNNGNKGNGKKDNPKNDNADKNSNSGKNGDM